MGAIGDIEQVKERGVKRAVFRPERLEGVVNAVSDPISVQAADGRVVFANRAAMRAVGAESLDEMNGRGTRSPGSLVDRYEMFDEAGRPVEASALPGRVTLRTGLPQSLTLRYRDRASGAERWSAISAVPLLDEDGRPEFAVNIIHDVTESKGVEEALRVSEARSRLLADATRDLDESLDLERVIATSMALAVPGLADWATLDLIHPDGSAERVAVEVADPRRAKVANRMWRFAVEPGAGRAGDRAIAERRPVIANLSPERLTNDPGRPGLVETIRALGTTSAMAVPLLARGTVEGVLFLGACNDSRRYEEGDAVYAMELARRIGFAVGNARLYAAEQVARRAAEEAASANDRLFRDAAQYRTILDAVRDGVSINDSRTLKVTYANDALLEQLGRTRDEVVGHATPDWTEGLSMEQLRAFVRPIVTGEEASRTLDVIRIRPDGTRVPVEILWQFVDLPGLGPQLVAVSRSIRERIETEERLTQLARAEHARAAELNAVIGAIGEGLIVLDGDGRVTLANPEAQALLQPLESWTLEAVLARLEDPDGKALAALTEAGGSATLRLRAPAQQWVEVSNYAVDDEPNSDSEHIVILRDVTEAREREAVRDAFVGILSHELRTPVTTIYAGAKVLSRNEGRLEEEARKGIFDDIHAEAERLHRLVEDVVALTRFGEGAVDIGSEPVLLQRVVPVVVRSEQGRWPDGSFEVDLPAGLPPVSGDPTYVEQVIRNLLANAVKYGGSRPTIRLIARSDANEVQVRVLDEGPGFPEDEAARLFELYYRSPTTARSISGSGIGLFVCARLLHAMGGRIWAANRPEGGAEFGFALRVMGEERD